MIRRWVVLVAGIFCMLISSSVAQVHIKARVEIKPKAMTINPSILSSAVPVPASSTIRYEVSYSGGVSSTPGIFHVLSVGSYCDGTTQETDFNGSKQTFTGSANADGGVYVKLLRFYTTSAGTLSQRWYYGDVLVQDYTGDVSANSQVITNGSYPMRSGFKLNGISDMGHGGFSSVGVSLLDSYTPCLDPGWDLSFGITLEISGGAQYGGLKTIPNISLGETAPQNLGPVTCYYDELNKIQYIADGEDPDSVGIVTITATSGAVTASQSFKVYSTKKKLKIYAPDTLRYKDAATIQLQAITRGTGEPVDAGGATYSISIVEGSQWASLRSYDGSGQSGQRLSNLHPYESGYGWTGGDAYVDFSVDQKEPDSVYAVKLRATASNPPDILPDSAVVYVRPALCSHIHLSPDSITSGGKTTITMSQTDWDGTNVPYSDDQLFEVTVTDGYGYLQSPDGTQGTDVVGTQPFTFYADSTINTDLAKVSIQASPYFPPVANSIKSTKSLHAPKKAMVNNFVNKLNLLKKSSKISQTKLNSDILPITNPLPLLCQLLSYLKIKSTTPYLEVVYPKDGALEKKEITRDPKMPDITLQARLNNYTGGEVKFEWNLRVQWTGPDGREFDDPFHKYYTTANNSDISSWKVDWNNMIRGGDEITLDVTATTADGQYNITVNHPFKIVGLNPNKAETRNELSLEEQVIAYLESRFRQYWNDHDYPVWGTPSGYGIMQVDPPSNNEQVWNWKANIEEGCSRFGDKKAWAKKYPARTRNRGGKNKYATDFNNDQWLTEAFQEYNGFNCWVWAPNPLIPSIGSWIKDPTLGVTHGKNYGGTAIKLYNDVSSGNPPKDW
jgi:hypothetical protein